MNDHRPTASSLRRTGRPIVVLAVALSSFAGFCGGRSAAIETGPALVRDVDRLYYADGGAIRERMKEAIFTQADFEAWWDRATADRPTTPALPAIEWGQEIVVIVAWGQRKVGDEVRVQGADIAEVPVTVDREEEVLRVFVNYVDGCSGFEQDVFPLEIVRIRTDGFDGNVTWQETDVRGSACG